MPINEYFDTQVDNVLISESSLNGLFLLKWSRVIESGENIRQKLPFMSKPFSIEVTTSSEELLFQERPMTPENPEAVRASAIAPVFIYRKTTKPQTNFFVTVFYKAGDRTEHLLCKLQIFRRIPLRSKINQ